MALVGYMQSWKYFNNYKESILSQFTFKAEIIEASVRLLNENLYQLANEENWIIHRSNVTLVGVHVRRRDMTSNYNHKRGYAVASKEYIDMAMSKMECLLENTSIIYVVISDDMKWCRREIMRTNRRVIFYSSGCKAKDLSVMSGCDHSIITSGTFGWWGGYLAGGHTIYYSRYPEPGSYISKITKLKDYYPPWWIGLP